MSTCSSGSPERALRSRIQACRRWSASATTCGAISDAFMSLTDPQFERYARHLILDEVGEEGQEKLMASRVLVVGAGGLGSPLLLYLAAAGIGTLGIVDHDH